ncbi:MAG: NUDIX hydrolase [Capsulimonadaceae bacterium]|nr:NUDIX hydrolase [Capsulimonadaceae bacterium]
MDITETVLSTKRVYEGKVINLRVDTVRLPNGREATREVVEHNGAMAAVPLLDDGRVVLVRQNRLPAGGPLLEIPAGSLNRDENVEDCVRRELIEEIQLSPGRIHKLFSMFVAPGYSSEQIHVYLAQDLTPTPGVGDDDEFIIQEVITLDEALAKIDSGEIRDAKSIAGLLCVSRLRSASAL